MSLFFHQNHITIQIYAYLLLFVACVFADDADKRNEKRGVLGVGVPGLLPSSSLIAGHDILPGPLPLAHSTLGLPLAHSTLGYGSLGPLGPLGPIGSLGPISHGPIVAPGALLPGGVRVASPLGLAHPVGIGHPLGLRTSVIAPPLGLSPYGLGPAPLGLAPAPLGLAHGPLGLAHGPLGLASGPLALGHSPLSLGLHGGIYGAPAIL